MDINRNYIVQNLIDNVDVDVEPPSLSSSSVIED